MALKDCVKKLGAALNKQDLDAIKALVSGGMPEEEAVKYHLKKLENATRPTDVELVAYHNIDPSGLIHAAKMGGLAVPSIAVTKRGQPHSGFGSITLIGTKELVDPETTPVYDADAYSVRYPTAFYSAAKSKDVQKLIDSVKTEAHEFGDRMATQEPWDDLYGRTGAGRGADPHKAVTSIIHSTAWKAKYLRETGVKVEPVMRIQRHPDPLGDMSALKSLFKKNPPPEYWYQNTDRQDVMEWSEKFKAALKESIEQYATKKSKGDAELKEIYLSSVKDWYDGYINEKTGVPYFAPVEKLERGMRESGERVVDSGATSNALNKLLVGKESDFLKWAEGKVFPLMSDPQLKIGKKRVPYTLDNIVDYMTGKGRGVEKGLVFSEGSTRASVAKRFKNFPQLKKAAAEGILQEDEVHAAREEAQRLMELYRDKVSQHTNARNWRGTPDTWEGLDGSMRAIARFLKLPLSRRDADGLKMALRAEDFNVDRINRSDLEIGVDAANALLIAPVPYFEAKPDRAVKLNEFVGAAVPANTPREVLDILEQNGIAYTTYGGTKELREKAINSLTDKLSKKKPTVLFQSGIDQTQTPEFKKWFGDSKVVDADGKPLVVYHGTAGNEISEFKPRTARAIWFAPDSAYAQKYADSREADNKQVIPVYLSVKNPLVIDMNGQENPPRGRGVLRYANSIEDVVGIAQQQGYDGVIFKNRKQTVEGFSSDEIAVFNPTQIKSATGNRGTFDPNNPSILFQSQKSKLGFYSVLADAARNLKQEKGTPEQMLAAIKKTPGVKPDEIEWTGLEEYLKLQGKSVTKQQITEYLDANGVQVEETVLGDAPDPNQDEKDIRRYEAKRELEALGYTLEFDMGGEGEIIDIGTQESVEFDDLPEDAQALVGEIDKLGEGDGSSAEEPKFSQYVLPGGENYKELLLTLPTPKEFMVVADQKKRLMEEYGVLSWFDLTDDQKEELRRRDENRPNAPVFKSSHFSQPNILAHVRFNERTDADGKRVLFVEEIQSDWAQKGRKEGFAPVDAKKPVVVFTAENNQKREVARFATGKEAEAYIAENDPNMNRLDYEDTTANGGVFRGGTPSAPFVTSTDAWVSLALKRMITYAAENGFDRVAWTTGEQQADRYDLSKQIDKISYERAVDHFNEKGEFTVEKGRNAYSVLEPGGELYAEYDSEAEAKQKAAEFTRQLAEQGGIPKDEYELHVYDKAGKKVVERDGISISEIEEIVGKDIAKKIESGDGEKNNKSAYRAWRDLSGLDLKVGGEGMKAFYDSIVPKAAEKIIKKMGGKVAKTTIQQSEGKRFGIWLPDIGEFHNATYYSATDAANAAASIGGEARSLNATTSEQPGFDITPQMREQVAGQGMALFQKAQRNDLGLYSAVEQAVIDTKLPQWSKNEAAPGVEIWSKVSKTQGVKAEELEWMGLEDFLKSEPKAKFTRQQVLEFVANNGVEVVLVTADNQDVDENYDSYEFEWRESVDEDSYHYEHRRDKLIDDYGTDSQDEDLYRGAVQFVLKNKGDHIAFTLGLDSPRDNLNPESDTLPENLYIPSKKKRIFELSPEDREKGQSIWSKATQDERRGWIRLGTDNHPGGYYLPQVVDYALQNYADEIKNAYEVDAETQAYNEYMQDPYTIYTDGSGISIEGNDLVGYRIIDQNGDVYREGIDGFNEAEVQARSLIESNVGTDPSTITKWDQYVMDGDHSNYRELKFTLPGVEGKFVKSTHFSDPNIVAFLRVTDRDLYTGEPLEEIPARKIDYRISVEGVDRADVVIKKSLVIRDNANDTLIASAPLREDADDEKSIAELKRAMSDAVQRKGVERVLTFTKGYRVDDEGGITFGGEKPKPRPARAYHMDEFQSDWHQEGRKNGYRVGDAAIKKMTERRREINAEIIPTIAKLWENMPRYTDALLDVADTVDGPARKRTSLTEGDTPIFDLGEHGQDEIGVMEFRHRVWTLLEDMRPEDALIQKTALLTHRILHRANELGDIKLDDLISMAKESRLLELEIERGQQGVPNAPFKGDAWLNLGIKRAIVDAVENGYKAISWPNANVLSARWSENYRTLYETQYDTKMPSIVKKLTGIKPRLMDMDGDEMMSPDERKSLLESYLSLKKKKDDFIEDTLYDKYRDTVKLGQARFAHIVNMLSKGTKTSDAQPVVDALTFDEIAEVTAMTKELVKMERAGVDVEQQGYWIIPITKELRDKVKENSFPLFQPKGSDDLEFKRGAIQLLPNGKRVIHLGENSDASTLIHELAHSYLELEKQLADEFGITPNQKRLLEWLGVESFDDIGVAQHEMYAETFESYMETGKAPSPFLREVFANFRRWITDVYKMLRGRPNAKLDSRVTEYFDRLLATEDEIEMVAANPVFDQFFRSKEQSGMTDAEWAKYQEQGKRVSNAALATIDQKVIAELKKRKSAEWKEEKEPLVDEEKERLSKLPVYRVLRDASEHPMDYDAIVEVTGGKLPGKLIGRAKKGGINPLDYAEGYGFESIKAMIDVIESSPALGKAADDAAEKRMVEKYGDILNDGSIEQEARDAIHNEEQAKLLLMELKALNKRTTIDRGYLESEARRMISGMKYSEIKPDKYYKAEIRAARKAMSAKTDDERYEAKAQQIANHYLYRRALEVRDAMEKQRKYVRGVQTRNYNTKEVDASHVQNMKMLAKSYEMRKDDPLRPRNYAAVLDWMVTQMQDENHYVQLEIVDINLAKALVDREQGKDVKYDFPGFDDLTADELQSLYDQLKHLRFVGGKMSENAKADLMISRANSAESISRNAQKVIPPEHERSAMASVVDSVVKFGFSHLRVRSIFKTLDGYERGPMDKEYALITDAFNKELALTDQLAKSMDAVFLPVFRIINRRRQTTITKQDGRDWTLSNRARFVLGLNWGNEGNRQALLEGLNNKFADTYTEADVVQMLTTMSHVELQALNDVWAAKEVLWPELSGAQVRIKGVAPPKIQATPFEINGVKLTGGHYRLHYVVDPADSGRKDITIEDNQRDSILMKTASSLHERVGSGGRQVDLELNHLFRDIQEDIHYIAFAEQAEHLNAMFKGAKNPVVGAITKGYGQPYYDNLITTLDAMIHPAEPTTGMWKLMRYVRSNLTYAYLAGSVRNLVQQPVAITNAVSQLGGGYVTAGALEFYANPVKNWEMVREKSPFMRNRTELVNREATEQLTKIDSIHPIWGAIKRGAFMPQTFMDSLVAFPTWMGALRKFQQENPKATEDEGIRYADEMVAHTIGSGLSRDIGAILSGSEAEKQITFMGTFFNLTINMHVENYQLYKRDKINGFEYARRLGWMAVAPAILTAFLLDDMPEDEDESDLLAMLKNVLFYNFSSVFMVRDLISAFEGFEPSLPGLSFGKGITRVTKEMTGLITGDEEFDMTTIASIIRGVQPLTPVPGSSQVARTLEGLADENQDPWGAIVEGKERN